ncbi:hypothetical protein [Marinomonas transparens]|uniref:Cutinase n=1 Tax=Marinomonas transparens TaxID=2795388 RepID=A0A934N1B3_9GAMM|nr:hypothetical protein [Marinomonas transparens]MBJ7537592.1 hypothetical protein [Marinomonas transparens]
MMRLINPVRNINKFVLCGVLALALYAPAKDVLTLANNYFAKQTIQIVDASFGTRMPWQTANTDTANFVKVSQTAQTSLSRSQIIYTKLRFDNPTSQPQTYRKVWLNFDHENGDQEYTTDYTLYNAETRQRLIGESVQVGPNTSVEVVAAYRFIPSYKNRFPVSMSVSWEGKDFLREEACKYNLKTSSGNYFAHQCAN